LGRGEPPKHVKYAPILKNSVAFKETANERLFLMKDLADLSFRSLRNVMTQAKVLFMPRLSRPRATAFKFKSDFRSAEATIF